MDIAVGTPFNPADGNPSHTITWSGGEGTNLIVFNESYQNLYIKFSGGQISYVPANDRRQYTLEGEMAQAQPQATFTIQSQINNKNTVNQVVVESYAPGEEVPETYPSPLIRQANIAGTIIAQLVELFSGNNMAVLQAGQSLSDISVAIDSGGFMEVGGALGSDSSGMIQINNNNPLIVNAAGVGSSGTAAIFEPFGGVGTTINIVNPFKLTLIKFTNWINKTVQTIDIDNYENGATLICMENGPFSLTFNGGAALSGEVLTTLASTGGSTTGVTVFNTFVIGDIKVQFNQIQFATNNGAHNGFAIILGW